MNRSFEGAFVILKMKDDKLLWQLDVMKTCTEEIQNRLQIRKNPVSFKLSDVTVEVDTDPNYFSGQTVAPLTLPLKLRIKAFPPSNALFNATLDATIQDDGSIKMGDFHTFQN